MIKLTGDSRVHAIFQFAQSWLCNDVFRSMLIFITEKKTSKRSVFLYMWSCLDNINLTKVNFVTALKGFPIVNKLEWATWTMNRAVDGDRQAFFFSFFIFDKYLKHNFFMDISSVIIFSGYGPGETWTMNALVKVLSGFDWIVFVISQCNYFGFGSQWWPL